MKLAKIELKDFGGFHRLESFTFDLGGGKNLLLYGESGSSKSSLYRKLVEFFNLDPKARPFSCSLAARTHLLRKRKLPAYVALSYER